MSRIGRPRGQTVAHQKTCTLILSPDLRSCSLNLVSGYAVWGGNL